MRPACAFFPWLDFRVLKEPLQCKATDLNTACAKLLVQLNQREIRIGRDTPQQPLPLALQARATMPTHRLGGYTPRLSEALHPFQRRASTHTALRSRLPVRCASFHRNNDARSQILRIWPAALYPFFREVRRGWRRFTVEDELL